MKVSVITSTFNRSQYLRDTINSFLSQNYQDKEMILINNGGTEIDPSLYADSRIRYFSKEPTNLSVSFNYGIEKSSGELICILDDDDVFYDDFSLSKRVEIFKNNPDLDVIWTRGRDTNEKLELWGEKELFKGTLQNLLNRDDIYIMSMMWRKSIKSKIGSYFFDRDLSCNEDWDFKIRCYAECNARGFDIYTVKHRFHNDQWSSKLRLTGEMARSQGILLEKLKKKYAVIEVE